MKFREQRGSTADSKATEVEMPPLIPLLKHHLDSVYRLSPFWANKLFCGVLQVDDEDMGPDERVGWDHTYIVTLDGDAIGFCDRVPFPNRYHVSGPAFKASQDTKIWAVRDRLADDEAVAGSFMSLEHAERLAHLMNEHMHMEEL